MFLSSNYNHRSDISHSNHVHSYYDGNHDTSNSYHFNNYNDEDQHPPQNMLLITDYLDSNYDRYIEWNQSLPINSEDVVGEYLPLSHPWGYLYSHRILCLIITLWPTRKTKMEIISKTYGNGCTKLMFVVDKASNPPSNIFGYETMIIELTRIQGIDKKKRNIWEKVHRMWTTVYQTPSLIENYDWFIKADDDTFIITENLHGFVQYLDPDFTHYLGHSIRSRWEVLFLFLFIIS